MTLFSGNRPGPIRPSIAALLAGVLLVALLPLQASAATITVASAIQTQNGSVATVSGYVVGQPTATSTVVTSNYPNDYALALADTAAETNTARMLYVQIPAAFRASYGLRSNPGLRGKQLSVTGTLSAYFSHAGLKNATAFTGGGTDPSEPPAGYYDDAIGKTGPELKAALHAIISDQTKLSYDQVWVALRDTDQDPNNSNNIVTLYEGRSMSKTANGGDQDDWNREHTWAQSHGGFGTGAGPGTDVHHLRPTDVTVNSIRGNKDFDNGGSPVPEAPDNFTDGDSYEPRDTVKGDVARMILYMSVRYEGGDGFANLEPNDAVNNGSSPLHGRLSVLKAWSAADPPDAFEQRRNEVIYATYQHNRNPFIDHPEWVTAIWG